MSGRLSWSVSRSVLIFLASAIAYSSATAADDTTYRLAYHFKVGQFFHYEVSDRAELTTQMASTQSKAVQQTQCLKSYRVVAVDEQGGATLEPVVESVRMSSQTGDKAAVSFDSTKDEVVPKGFENLAGTIGRPLARFQVAANGRLLKVTLLVNDIPKKFSEAAQKTDPTINFLVVFPEQAIKVADKWNEKFETQVSVGNNLKRELSLIRTFELAQIANHVATIRFRTTLLTPMSDPEILRQLVQQTPSGTIEFDLKEGRILTRSLQIDEKVVGAFGAQTLLQAQGESVEKLIPETSPARVSSGAPKALPN